MAWPKIKNIIILMLLVTNLCLLAFVGWREIRDWQLQDKALEQAVSFLAERGIQVDERIVPRSAELPPMGMERDLEEEQTLAAALLGDGLTREERSGEVYVYAGERGLLQCHSSGEFWADFQSGAFPVPEGAEMAEHALGTMELLHFQGEVVSSAGNAQDGSVTLRQLWNGVPVLPCRATLVYEGGELKRIEGGRRLTGTPQTTAGTPITATTALMRFYAGLSERMDICSEVREIEIAYTLSNALGGPISLIPVWHITTDTEQVEVTIPVLKMKEVPITFEYTGVPQGYDTSVLGAQLSQESILIAGPAERVDALESVSAGFVDLTKFKLGETVTLAISLPDGIRNLDALQSVDVTFDTYGFATRTVTVSQISVVNAPGDTAVTVTTRRLNDVTLVGPEEELNALSEANVVAQVDASAGNINVSKGQQSMPATIVAPGSDTVFATGSYEVLCDIDAAEGAG